MQKWLLINTMYDNWSYFGSITLTYCFGGIYPFEAFLDRQISCLILCGLDCDMILHNFLCNFVQHITQPLIALCVFLEQTKVFFLFPKHHGEKLKCVTGAVGLLDWCEFILCQISFQIDKTEREVFRFNKWGGNNNLGYFRWW